MAGILLRLFNFPVHVSVLEDAMGWNKAKKDTGGRIGKDINISMYIFISGAIFSRVSVKMLI